MTGPGCSAVECAALAVLPSPGQEFDTRTAVLAQSTFEYAARAWLETRKGRIAPRTVVDYQNYIRILSRFFGEMRLPEISGDQVRAYQDTRRLRASAQTINKELSVLIQMRKRIGREIADYQPLQVDKDYQAPGRRLTDSEEAKLERVFRAAADHPLWNTAALASLLSMKTGLGPGEMLSLQLRNCSLKPPSVEVPRRGAKRVSRERFILLNETAAWALDRLVKRANRLGSVEPGHFLFPRRGVNHQYDPTRPAAGYREALRGLLAIAGIKCRRYDFRHHAVSCALGDPRVSRQDAISYFGWVSAKMFRRYHHADLKALNVVAAAIEHKGK